MHLWRSRAPVGVVLALALAATGRGQDGLPSVKIGGDVRLRGETLSRGGSFPGDDMERGRMRLRLALDSDLGEGWKAGLRLASGGSPTSTNENYDALNNKVELYIDRAFARYTRDGDTGFDLLAGRMPNPYVRSMILWDSDFNPDGLSEKVSFGQGDRKFFVTLGQHVLSHDPATKSFGTAVYGVQPGLSLKTGEGSLTLATAYYAFGKAGGIDDVPADGDYSVADLYVSFSRKPATGPPLTAWVDIFKNLDADNDGTAVGAGVAVGSSKEHGGVKASLAVMSVDRNALWVNLGDATSQSGLYDENMNAMVLGISAGLGGKATLGASWYYKDARDIDARENVIILDLVTKF